MLIGGAGYIINDVFDYPIDCINRPERPLPSGRMTPRFAWFYGMFLFTLGIGLSWMTGSLASVGVAMLNSLLLFYYARRFKMATLSGNFIVALLAFTPFLYGGLVTGNTRHGAILGLFAAFLTLIRELVKDLEDVDGDRQLGGRTLAVIAGSRGVARMAGFALLAFTLLVVQATRYTVFSPIAGAILIAVTVIPLSIGLLRLSSTSHRGLSRFSLLLKLEMLLALGVVLLG
jgi:geranylgeranylglycerol-phosphate geranylgeranyltransferase